MNKQRAVSILLVLMALAATAVSAEAAGFEPEVIAWWRFEPADFLADSSGNGHTLSTTGALGSGSPGAVLSSDTACGAGSGSAYFDGNAIMQTVEKTLNLTPYNHIAISWWQKIEGTSSALIWEHSVNYNNHNGGFAGVANQNFLTNQPGTGGVGVRRTTTPGGYNIDTYSHASDNSWQHFTAQINLGLPATAPKREVVKVFRDGALVSSGNPSHQAQAPSSFGNYDFFLGTRANFVSTSRLNGWLDEVKIETASSYVNDVAKHPNLLGYWRLGEPAGPTAYEVKGVVGNGTYVNTTAGDFSRPGAINFDLDTAMRFNGSTSYMDAGNHPSLNGAWDGLTVAAWIKFEDVTGLSAIVSKWAGTHANDHFQFSISDERKIGIIVNHGQTPTGSGVSTRGDTQLTPDEWHFVAGTWEAGTGTYNLYVNGKLDGTGTQYTPDGVPKVINTNSNAPLRIGAMAGTGGFARYFDGWIDEVAVFNTALSGDELMMLYRTATVPEPSTTLLAIMGLLGLLIRRRRR